MLHELAGAVARCFRRPICGSAERGLSSFGKQADLIMCFVAGREKRSGMPMFAIEAESGSL